MLFFTVATHMLPVGYRNRFQWDKEAAREIRSFGSWIMGSSAVTFLGGQADRLLLGRFLGTAWLGIYGIALTLAESIGLLAFRLVHGVMYPALSEIARRPDGNISQYYYRLRRWLDPFGMGAVGLLAGIGPWIVRLLWDVRYVEAGWILRILCVRTAIGLLVVPCENCLYALGYTNYGFVRSMARFIGALVCIPIGWRLAGVKGVVWGTTAAELFTLFAIWPKGRALGILRLRRELLAIGIFAASFALASAAEPWLPRFHIR
jgi:O-antigen/teichoic acid export membrane protein